jgi:hypothetical protein
MLGQHKRHRPDRQPGAGKPLIDLLAQQVGSLRVVRVEDLHLHGATRRVLFGHQVNQPFGSSLKRAHLAHLHIGPAHRLDPNHRFEIQHGGDQPFHVADPAAVNQVFQVVQRIQAVAGLPDPGQQGQDLLLRPAGFDSAQSRGDLPPGCRRQGLGVNDGHVCLGNLRRPGLGGVDRAAQAGRDVNRENFRVLGGQAPVHLGKDPRRGLRGHRKGVGCGQQAIKFICLDVHPFLVGASFQGNN